MTTLTRTDRVLNWLDERPLLKWPLAAVALPICGVALLLLFPTAFLPGRAPK